MEFKRKLIFDILDNMSSCITSVELVDAIENEDCEVIVKVDTTRPKRNNALRQKLRSTLTNVRKSKLQIDTINVGGGLTKWDIVMLCKKDAGHCTGVEMTMSPNCQIRFIHGTGDELKNQESLNNMKDSLETLFRIKDTMLNIATSKHKDYETVHTANTRKTQSTSTETEESSNSGASQSYSTPVKITLKHKPDPPLRMLGVKGKPQCLTEIENTMDVVAELTQATAGLTSLTTSSTRKLIFRMTNACLNGSRDVQSPLSDLREHLEVVSNILDGLETSISEFNKTTKSSPKKRKPPQPRKCSSKVKQIVTLHNKPQKKTNNRKPNQQNEKHTKQRTITITTSNKPLACMDLQSKPAPRVTFKDATPPMKQTQITDKETKVIV